MLFQRNMSVQGMSFKMIALIGVLSMGPLVPSALAQDAAAGEKVYGQCRACHQVGEKARNTVGPVLNGLFGRTSGTIEGYNYTEANKKAGIVWSEETFAEYIKNPRAAIPGTKMIFGGLKDEKRIQDLIAFLKQYDAAGKKAE